MTKAAFAEAYRHAVATNGAPWTREPGKLDAFMEAVETTLAGGFQWAWNTPSTQAAWHAIGGKGTPTLKALRALS